MRNETQKSHKLVFLMDRIGKNKHANKQGPLFEFFLAANSVRDKPDFFFISCIGVSFFLSYHNFQK